MKKIFAIIFFLVCANAVTDENLDIKINQEVNFGDGFGTITGYPQNIAKEFRDKIKFIGEYNLDKNTGNLTIRFKRIQYDGKIYELTESYEKRMRLKKPRSAKIKAGGKILVAGGSKQEILDIVNQKKQELAKAENDNALKELERGEALKDSANLNSILSGGSSGTNSNNYPYYLETGSTSDFSKGDYSNSTTNSDGTCKAPSIKDGVVNIYTTSSAGGSCKLFTASESSIYYKTNTPSCQNKIDFENKTIRVGKEGFVTLDDNKEYKVIGCQYTDDIPLKREIGKCKAIPNYKEKTAQVQKQYYYEYNNERFDVGGCATTEEKVPLEEDLNKCDYRHDFVRKLSIKQTQFFYMYDNKRYDIGECVDKDEEGFRFSHYEDDSTCKYDVHDGRVIYQQRIAFDGLDGGRKYATDCRVVSSGGLEILEEHAGYIYHDNIKQAQRKVNQYFIIPQTTQKKYLAKNVAVDKTYPYETSFCKWENNDEDKISTRYSKVFFRDTDENKEVIVSDCSDTIGLNIMPYVYLGEERTVGDKLTGKTLIPEGDSWKIYGTDNLISNSPNYGRNIDSQEWQGEWKREHKESVNCQDKLKSIYGYTDEQISGLEIQNGHYSERRKQGQDDNVMFYKVYCKNKTKKLYGTNQILEQTEIKETWRRGDGTKYQPKSRIEWRAK